MVTSAHKTLPAWSQAALVLARTACIDAARPGRGCRGVRDDQPRRRAIPPAPTRPAPCSAERDGEELLAAAIAATAEACDLAHRRRPPVVPTAPTSTRSSSPWCSSGTGADGNAVEQDLLAAGLPVESADRDVIVAIVSPGRHLRQARPRPQPSCSVPRTASRRTSPRRRPAVYGVDPTADLPPRRAFFAAAETVTHRRWPARPAAPAPSSSRRTAWDPGARARRTSHRLSTRRARPGPTRRRAASRTPRTRVFRRYVSSRAGPSAPLWSWTSDPTDRPVVAGAASPRR